MLCSAAESTCRPLERDCLVVLMIILWKMGAKSAAAALSPSRRTWYSRLNSSCSSCVKMGLKPPKRLRDDSKDRHSMYRTTRVQYDAPETRYWLNVCFLKRRNLAPDLVHSRAVSVSHRTVRQNKLDHSPADERVPKLRRAPVDHGVCLPQVHTNEAREDAQSRFNSGAD